MDWWIMSSAWPTVRARRWTVWARVWGCRGSLSSSIRDLGRVYGLAGRGSAMVAVGLGGDWATRGSAQVTDSDSQQARELLFSSWLNQLQSCFHFNPVLSDLKQVSDLILAGPDSGPGEWELLGEHLGLRAQQSPRRGSLSRRGGRLRGRDRTGWNEKVQSIINGLLFWSWSI